MLGLDPSTKMNFLNFCRKYKFQIRKGPLSSVILNISALSFRHSDPVRFCSISVSQKASIFRRFIGSKSTFRRWRSTFYWRSRDAHDGSTSKWGKPWQWRWYGKKKNFTCAGVAWLRTAIQPTPNCPTVVSIRCFSFLFQWSMFQVEKALSLWRHRFQKGVTGETPPKKKSFGKRLHYSYKLCFRLLHTLDFQYISYINKANIIK